MPPVLREGPDIQRVGPGEMSNLCYETRYETRVCPAAPKKGAARLDLWTLKASLFQWNLYETLMFRGPEPIFYNKNNMKRLYFEVQTQVSQ